MLSSCRVRVRVRVRVREVLRSCRVRVRVRVRVRTREVPSSCGVASAGTRAKAHSERGVSSAHLVRVRVRVGGRVRVRGSGPNQHSVRCVSSATR